MAISIEFTYTTGLKEKNYVSGNHYTQILKSGTFLGKTLQELKLVSSGEIFNFTTKLWSDGKPLAKELSMNVGSGRSYQPLSEPNHEYLYGSC